ncbi:MAG: hypothetical protein GC172_07070 [Phycisphaera sp.]|nr:hypothetical protein [Phycisphaera sp.]
MTTHASSHTDHAPSTTPPAPPALPVGSTYEAEAQLPGGATMALALVPATEGEPSDSLRGWVESDPEARGAPAVWMSFQGTHVHWSTGRCAIAAPVDRVAAVRAAILEATAHERALRSVEEAMASAWPALESDSELAFEFEEASVVRRRELRERLHRTLVLRARLARIAPYLLAPLAHPPTLGSQVGERLRERLRMPTRHEAATTQLEVFCDTYGMCGQRASEFMLARTGHRLEWVIIILLAVQLLLWGFEYLAEATGG